MAKAKTRTIVRYAKPKRHHKRSFTIPLAVVAGFTPLVTRFAANALHGEGIDYAGKRALEDLTGYRVEDGKWSLGGDHTAKYGLYPIAAGLGVHWIASKLGVNRMLGRMGVPLVRI